MKKKIGNLTFKKIEGEGYLVYTTISNNKKIEPICIGEIALNAYVKIHCFKPYEFLVYGDSTLKIIANFMKRLNKNLEGENE